MAVAGCELRRGDDGTMRARDKESHRGLALRIHTLLLVFHYSSKLLLFPFLFFFHFFFFFSFLFVFIYLTAYAIIAFIPEESKYGNKRKGKGKWKIIYSELPFEKKKQVHRGKRSRIVSCLPRLKYDRNRDRWLDLLFR